MQIIKDKISNEEPKRKIIHKDLASGRWFELSLIEQLANVGCDVERTIAWKKNGNLDYSQKAFEGALDLLYLTIEDPKNKKCLKKIMCIKEALIDHFQGNNEYATTEES